MRRSGVLLHITSLPSPGGIGTMGKSAYAFVDFMQKSGLSVWQVLPIGPTGCGESPYQSASTFAGNPLLIDLALLKEEGLLRAELPLYQGDPNRVDFPWVKREKTRLLKQSFDESFEKLKPSVEQFANHHAWAKDYALFMAIRAHFADAAWHDWPDKALVKREPGAILRAADKFAQQVNYHLYTQYLFFRQWTALKTYANNKGILLFGDMPIYVAEDSADCWTNPSLFKLDAHLRPTCVAGVPPDYFSRDGQRWGNPIYDWRAMKREKFSWWISRLSAAMELYDWLRIDHFIGFANYYSIPVDSSTARSGAWRRAPGFSLFRRVKRELGGMHIVAEDLGEVGPRVARLLRFCGYPGMRVLCFGFDSDMHNPHFPSNIPQNCVVYTGTHDNDTVIGWWDKLSLITQSFAESNLPPSDNIADAMIACAFFSDAETAIIPMQDFLHCNSAARMNTPGTVGGNWLFRMPPDAPLGALSETIFALNERSKRR